MKKILLGFGLIASGFAVNAQQQFNIGLGGGIYSTWLVNSNVSDQGDNLDFAATFCGQVGLNATYYFNEKLGIASGVFVSGNSQKYTGSGGPDASYEAKTKLKYVDIPLLLRFGGGAKGAYFEFGPQFCFLTSAKEQFISTPASPNDYKDRDVKSSLNGSTVAGVLGFGVDIDASEDVVVTTGLRLGYGFSDVTKNLGSKDAALAYAYTEEASIPEYFAHFDNKNNFKYKSTNRAFGGLFLGVMYKIPQKGKSTPVPETK